MIITTSKSFLNSRRTNSVNPMTATGIKTVMMKLVIMSNSP
nr:MAG TPA: hypothetical protein [Caudoviricetes sp.]